MTYILSIVGAQFGDEGKGKITDMLAEHADIVARSAGGNNAGHTIVKDSQKYALHLLPSGVLYQHTINIIGAGVKFDPLVFQEELVRLKENGINPKILISPEAHCIMEWHVAFDKGSEKSLKDEKIGTTCRGVGPCVESTANRKTAIRVTDLISTKLPERIEKTVKLLLPKLVQYHANFRKFQELPLRRIISMDDDELQVEVEKYIIELIKKYRKVGDYISSFVSAEIVELVNDEHKFILGEGAQGTMLDPLFGTFPDVTSTHPIAGGLCTGLGLGPTKINDVLGIFKAYETRVGEGIFPTELNDKNGERLRKLGAEFGTTTGRPRRCGWFNLDEAKYVVKVNGMTWFALTKLDVLDSFREIKVLVNNKYKTFDGWEADLTSCSRWEELPDNAKEYVQFLEKNLCPMAIVSVGPSREETIIMPEFAKYMKTKGIEL